MNWRTVHINDEEWRYYIGRGNVKIMSPNGNNSVARFSDVTGEDQHSIEHDIGKYNFHVRPQQIKDYIVRRIL